MTQTHIGRLQTELKRAAAALASFEEFRSPVNQAVVLAAWTGKRKDQIIRVAVHEDGTGTFYRGQITDPSMNGKGWVVLADDHEVVGCVTASMFASVMLVDKP